ncbi:hypothetical protein [Marinobacterium jannaschii]|uniref:hypothetical protein n=1 Tax=Marinobacterium jannaschii TaxID=64970 RepID=UPI0012ECAF4E|nr:hypothetical protein [Marinobacterium jannaschii]
MKNVKNALKIALASSAMMMASSVAAADSSGGFGGLASGQGVTQIKGFLIFVEAACLLVGLVASAFCLWELYNLKMGKQTQMQQSAGAYMAGIAIGGTIAVAGIALEFATGTMFGDSSGTKTGLQQLRGSASIEHVLPEDVLKGATPAVLVARTA